MSTKIVYLATPKGPQSFSLAGNWITAIEDAAPKKARKKRAAKAAPVEDEAEEAPAPKVRRPRRANGEATQMAL